MQNPKVSVIIPVYNAESFIEEALESALAQTYKNIEIIVVNDGSTDKSYEKIKPYLASIKYISQENKGVSSARNNGIRQSKGELIAFLDSDDIWLPDKLDLQVDYLRNNPDVGLVHTNISCINGSGVNIKLPFDIVTGIEGKCFKDLFKRNGIANSTVLVRRTCLDKVGLFFDGAPCTEDYEMWMRISIEYPIGFINRTLMFYRVHESGVSQDSFRQALDVLVALNSIISRYPDVYREVGKAVVNARVAELYFEVGNEHIWKLQDLKAARKYFFNVIRRQPTYWVNYRYFLWCSLTTAQRRAISWYWHRVKTFFEKFFQLKRKI